jgi:hypothetical protein
MKKTLGLLIVLGLASTPALAQKITIDYAHDFDFSTVRTFQYVETKDTDSKDPLMDERIEKAIMGNLSDGLKQVESNPDIYVTYHVTTQNNTVLNTTSFGYGGWGAGWGGWGMGGGVGMGSSTTTASTYTDGTLIIDAYDSTEKKMVFRGTGTVTLKAKPEKQIQQIDKILTKMDAKWQKIRVNQGK